MSQRKNSSRYCAMICTHHLGLMRLADQEGRIGASSSCFSADYAWNADALTTGMAADVLVSKAAVRNGAPASWGYAAINFVRGIHTDGIRTTGCFYSV